MIKIGIIFGRFHADEIHKGHYHLYNHVLDNNDQVYVLLGNPVTKFTQKDPLPYEVRKVMIEGDFKAEVESGKLEVHPMGLYMSNEVWASKIDEFITSVGGNWDNVMIYGSRDSSIPTYIESGGGFRTELVESIDESISASAVRKEIGQQIIDSRDFRKGIIYVTQNKYPTLYSTVDIAIMSGPNRILLGRKPNEDKFRFVGGFVDVTDANDVAAARREVKEECGDIEVDNFRYITSMKVDDWRYRNSGDGIMTRFFVCDYIFGKTQAGDDLEEVKWFKLDEFDENDILGGHRELLRELRKTLSSPKVKEKHNNGAYITFKPFEFDLDIDNDVVDDLEEK